MLKRVPLVLFCLVWTVTSTVLTAAAVGYVVLTASADGMPSANAHGTGRDAEWLGHAWVDGRRTQSDVDSLARRLGDTGIKDLFVHAGPFRDDGTLDPALRPKATWMIGALHRALPGVRVDAWLGAHPVPGEMRLSSSATRANVVTSLGQVLDDGFDGVHLDFEPVVDGDPDLLAMLDQAHALTRARQVPLSVSASHTAPFPLLAQATRALPWSWAVWSGGYLHQVALRVDQVALMVYDSALPTAGLYTGYVRRSTEGALAEVPPSVGLLIGLPAYRDDTIDHHPDAETVAATLLGVRLALGDHPPDREFGVAIYVDFTATDADWAVYHDTWAINRHGSG